jgi:hypothetical protein
MKTTEIDVEKVYQWLNQHYSIWGIDEMDDIFDILEEFITDFDLVSLTNEEEED